MDDELSKESEIHAGNYRPTRRRFLGLALALGLSHKLRENPEKVSAQMPAEKLKYKVYAPGVSRSDELSTPTEAFPWRREEILFGHNVGFQKLRENGMATVYIPPELSNHVTDASIEPWNKLGIELRGKPYFTITQDVTNADIRFQKSPQTWVQPFDTEGQSNFREPYAQSIIHSNIDPAMPIIEDFVATHELGHAAFGFVDFLTQSQYKIYTEGGMEGYVNPQNGSDPDKPYSGVMNYNDWYTQKEWFGKDDIEMLRVGGFV